MGVAVHSCTSRAYTVGTLLTRYQEGCFTVLYGLTSFFLLPNTPTSSPLLKDHEKKQVVAALHQDGIVMTDEDDPNYTWAEARRVFTCPHVLLIVLATFFNGMSLRLLMRRVSTIA